MFSGVIENSAVIDAPAAPEPVTIQANTVVSDDPILEISKTYAPELPGPNQPLTYTLTVTNTGQPAVNLLLTVSDDVPQDTTFRAAGPDGSVSLNERNLTWTRTVNLNTGDSTEFYYSVLVGDVDNGTVITNTNYQVEASGVQTAVGEPLETTIVFPELSIYKTISPDPPGSNRQATYNLTVLNSGSKATDLVITDDVPAGVQYVNGGSYSNGTISWQIAELDTLEIAEVSYMVEVPDLVDVDLVNDNFSVCSGELCADGTSLTSVILGPGFEVEAEVDPIAKGPGGGNKDLFPTLWLRNNGPGNAVDAQVVLYFIRISVSENDLIAYTPDGEVQTFPDGPECGENCVSYLWSGDLDVGEEVIFTTEEGQSTIGGEEGTEYSATIEVTDELGGTVTEPVSATATGIVTHHANLLPTKMAPETIGRGELLTYTFEIWNSGLSTEVDHQFPTLTDTVPANTTFMSASDGGVATSGNGATVVSWTLPAISTGEILYRSYVVQVADDLPAGTEIINDAYGTTWYESEIAAEISNTGEPVVTTVIETGLVGSSKVVTPVAALPGPDVLLTYELHIANTSTNPLENVVVTDFLPWQHSTYQEDVAASGGVTSDDIVSLAWTGDLAANSEEVLTFTVTVDPFYEGVITNTATIEHESLLEPLILTALAYITDDPVLQIQKSASPDPVETGDDLIYTIEVSNLAQTATNLVLYDVIPTNTTYVHGSASSPGRLDTNRVLWDFPILGPGESQQFSFRVQVGAANQLVNADYQVTSAEGASAVGEPVFTEVNNSGWLFLPIIRR